MACMKFFVFLAISGLILMSVQGRQFGKFSHDFSKVQSRNNINGESKVRLLIGILGSRPPRCERMCRSCGHCEAVQVPISPSMRYLHHHSKGRNNFDAINAYYSTSGDGISNYKPMRWKCKCGDFILNP